MVINKPKFGGRVFWQSLAAISVVVFLTVYISFTKIADTSSHSSQNDILHQTSDTAPASSRKMLISQQKRSFLDVLARDTWVYISSDWATDNHLPWSWRSNLPELNGGDFANPAEIGLYALSWVGAYEMQESWSPSWAEVEAEVTAVLDQLRAWQTGSQAFQPNGPNAYNRSVFYQWYWINWNPPVVGNDDADHVVPSIDNAWLAAALITIREYGEAHDYFEISQKADAILSDMNFDLWYHSDTHLYTWGATEDPYNGVFADYYSNENRLINFVARAMGQLNEDEFQQSLAILKQPTKTYHGIIVEKTAWDGSYFTYATPAVFIREINTMYGTKTVLPVTQAQIAYAQNMGYAAWGMSDCYDVGAGDYVQQGAPPAAMSGSPETRPGLVSPHASALALNTPLSSTVISNLQVISETFSCAYDPLYGFLDSVNVKPDSPTYGQCSSRFSALAQEWIFLAILNYKKSFVWDYFYRDPGVQTAHQEMYPMIYLPFLKR